MKRIDSQKFVIFNQFAKWGWDNRSYTDVTCYHYIKIAEAADRWIVANIQGRSLFSARYEDVKRFLFSSKPTARRRNSIRQALVAFMDYLVDEGYRTDNPARDLPRLKEPRKVVRAASADTAALLWAEAKAEAPMVTALMAVYLWGGVRRTEGRLLKWEEIDLVSNWIIIQGKGSGVREGRGKERRIWIHEELSWALRRWRKECPDPEWVFPSPRLEGRPVSEAWGRTRLKELGDRIGVHLHPHLLRHTVATNMVRRGAPVTAIQQFLGHASLETTQVYLDVEPADIEDAVKRVNFNEVAKAGP